MFLLLFNSIFSLTVICDVSVFLFPKDDPTLIIDNIAGLLEDTDTDNQYA